MRDAINAGLDEEMERDETVFIMGNVSSFLTTPPIYINKRKLQFFCAIDDIEENFSEIMTFFEEFQKKFTFFFLFWGDLVSFLRRRSCPIPGCL